MSKVMPTNPGWWWCRYPGEHAPTPIKVVHVIHGLHVLCRRSGFVGVRDMDVEWLAPVPSVEAVQALVAAAQRVSRALRLIGYNPAADELDNAIAGLTGEGE